MRHYAWYAFLALALNINASESAATDPVDATALNAEAPSDAAPSDAAPSDATDSVGNKEEQQSDAETTDDSEEENKGKEKSKKTKSKRKSKSKSKSKKRKHSKIKVVETSGATLEVWKNRAENGQSCGEQKIEASAPVVQEEAPSCSTGSCSRS